MWSQLTKWSSAVEAHESIKQIEQRANAICCTGGHRLAANFRPPINCKDAVQTFSGISSFRCSGDHDYLVMAVCPPAICLTFHFTRPKKEWEDFMLGRAHQMFAHPGECMSCHAFPEGGQTGERQQGECRMWTTGRTLAGSGQQVE